MLIQSHSIIWEHGFRRGQGLQHAVASRPMLQKAACLVLCVRHTMQRIQKKARGISCMSHHMKPGSAHLISY